MSEAETPFSREEISAFADGQLAEPRASLLAEWLAGHPEEQRLVETWRAEAELLREALAPAIREPVPEALLAILRPRRRLPFGLVAATLAGIAVGLAAGWGLWHGSAAGSARQIAAVGLSAHAVYAAEIRHPVEVWQNDEAHLTAWLSKRIDNPVNPPDLSGSGLKLLGGRIVPEDGRPAAMLMYEAANGERYSLLIAAADRPARTAFRYAEGDDAGAFYWIDGKLGYVFCGPDDHEVLRQLSQAVYDQLP